MKNEIETKLGTIVAEPAPDPNYPGFYLSLRRGNKTFSLCMLEVEQWNPDDIHLAAHVWDPEDVWGDPVFNMDTPAEVIDRMFEEED